MPDDEADTGENLLLLPHARKATPRSCAYMRARAYVTRSACMHARTKLGVCAVQPAIAYTGTYTSAKASRGSPEGLSEVRTVHYPRSSTSPSRFSFSHHRHHHTFPSVQCSPYPPFCPWCSSRAHMVRRRRRCCRPRSLIIFMHLLLFGPTELW